MTLRGLGPVGIEASVFAPRGWPSLLKLGAQHKKLRTGIESENDVIPV